MDRKKLLDLTHEVLRDIKDQNNKNKTDALLKAIDEVAFAINGNKPSENELIIKSTKENIEVLAKRDPKTKLPGVLLDKGMGANMGSHQPDIAMSEDKKLKKDGPNLDPKATAGFMSGLKGALGFGTPTPTPAPSSTGQINPGLASGLKGAFGKSEDHERLSKWLKKCNEMHMAKKSEDLDKAKIMDFKSGKVLADLGQPKKITPPKGELKAVSNVPDNRKPIKQPSEKIAKQPKKKIAKSELKKDDLKGVHAEQKDLQGQSRGGRSMAGDYIDQSRQEKPQYAKQSINAAKDEHMKVLNHLKQMIKPNLPKSEDGMKKAADIKSDNKIQEISGTALKVMEKPQSDKHDEKYPLKNKKEVKNGKD